MTKKTASTISRNPPVFASLPNPMKLNSQVDCPTTPMAHDVIPGLSKRQKSLPCKLLYDRRGSELFERICELPEYYVTRTERGIMEANIESIASAIGPDCQLVEFGSGNSSKTTFLLDHLETPKSYVPIDISRVHLLESARKLQQLYPDLDVLPIPGDFNSAIEIPVGPRPTDNRVVFFPGSTLGNLEEDEAFVFMGRIAKLVGPRGALLIGIDMKKPLEVLLPAYDDKAGVTAEFSLNMLQHINRELLADFDLDQFRHEAVWDEENNHIDISLVSLVDQVVTIGEEAFVFPEGERVAIEKSHKYTAEEFEHLAKDFDIKRVWSDEQDWFRVVLLQPRVG